MRFSASFAASVGRQAPMIASTGASVRPSSSDPANTAPPLTSSWIASQAPTPRMVDWKNIRAHLPMAPSITVRWLARVCAVSMSPRSARHRSVSVAPSPMVRAQSA